MWAITHEIFPILFECSKEGVGGFFVTAGHEVVCILTILVFGVQRKADSLPPIESSKKMHKNSNLYHEVQDEGI